jgi:hypothetical protein
LGSDAGTTAEAPANSLFTRPAIWSDVLELARLLERYRVRYVLVGGYALAAHGYVRMTQDIDIAVAPTPENAVRWIAALSHLPDHVAADMAGEEDPFQGDYLHAIRINDEFTVDVLPSVAGVSFEELETHAVAIEVSGTSLRVLDLEGLLLTKLRSSTKRHRGSGNSDPSVATNSVQVARNGPRRKWLLSSCPVPGSRRNPVIG